MFILELYMTVVRIKNQLESIIQFETHTYCARAFSLYWHLSLSKLNVDKCITSNLMYVLFPIVDRCITIKKTTVLFNIASVLLRSSLQPFYCINVV